MKKRSEVQKATRSDAPLVIFDLRERVPGMTDIALTTLHENALRLVRSDNERQRNAADALMPALEAEIATRAAKALAERGERKTTKKVSAATKRAQRA